MACIRPNPYFRIYKHFMLRVDDWRFINPKHYHTPRTMPVQAILLFFIAALPLRRTDHLRFRQWLTKWLTNQVETGGFNSDTICLNTQWNQA